MMVDRPKKKTTTRKRMMKTRIRSGAKTTTKDGLTEREREKDGDDSVDLEKNIPRFRVRPVT